MVRAAAVSDVGRARRTNEDWLVCDDKLGFFAVADGMGGHSAGEVASRLAIEAVESFIRRSHDDHEFSWPYGVDPTLSYDGNRLRTAINLANRRVFRAAEAHDDYTGALEAERLRPGSREEPVARLNLAVALMRLGNWDAAKSELAARKLAELEQRLPSLRP